MVKKKQISFMLLLVSVLLVSAVSFAQGTKDNDTAMSSAEALTTIKQNVVVPEQDVYDDSSGEKEKIYKKMSVFDTVIKFCITILATFLGAFFAFRFQNIREKVNIENKNYSALLKTQALFYQYLDVIYSIYKGFLYKFKDDSNRMREIPPISFCKSFAELDYEGLSFILATKEPGLYLNINMHYRKCISTIDAIEERNDHFKKIWGKGGIKENDKSREHCSLGISLTDSIVLESLTDIIYEQTEHTIKSIKEIDTQIQNFIKKQGFIKKTFKNKHPLNSPIWNDPEFIKITSP